MIRAKKRFGQNFLTDLSVIEKMLFAIAQSGYQEIFEIGPGTAALTAPLLQRGYAVCALELDKDLIGELTKRFHRYSEQQWTLMQGDVLSFDFSAYHALERKLLVSNLPYNISTPFFLKLVFEKVFRPGFFLVQKEVADRLCAQASDSAYGRLSVMVSTVFQFEKLFDVPQEAFVPAPKVQSTFVKMSLREKIISTDAGFEALVKQAFSQRRKTIANTLKSYSLDFSALGLSEKMRPQELTVEQYLALYRQYLTSD